MVAKDSDALVLHLGTCDALNARSEAQALLGVSHALDEIREVITIPILVCSVPPTTKNQQANSIRCSINEYLKYECAKYSDRMRYIDCNIKLTDLDCDGVHLLPDAQQTTCDTIIAEAVGFLRPADRQLF